MVSENPALPTLDPQLYEDRDDEEDLRLKAPLNALINGTQTPLQVAQNIDTIVRATTTERLQQCIDYVNTHNMTDEDYEYGAEWGNIPEPRACAYASQIIGHYSRVCSAFSPYSEGQNRLTGFLEALKSLPRWMAPESRLDQKGHVNRHEFWALQHKWLGLEDEFRIHLGSLSPRHHHVSADPNRWRNFQHAMARLTANQLIYCAPFNSLHDLVPTQKPKPNAWRYPEKKKRHPEHEIIAAAQWVIWPTECRYIYQECMKRKSAESYWEAFGQQQWGQWKSEFALVLESLMYDEQTKSVTRQALQQMKDVEEEADEDVTVVKDEDW